MCLQTLCLYCQFLLKWPLFQYKTVLKCGHFIEIRYVGLTAGFHDALAEDISGHPSVERGREGNHDHAQESTIADKELHRPSSDGVRERAEDRGEQASAEGGQRLGRAPRDCHLICQRDVPGNQVLRWDGSITPAMVAMSPPHMRR